MIKRIFFISIGFFFVVGGTLLLNYKSSHLSQPQVLSESSSAPANESTVFAALPQYNNEIRTDQKIADARPEIIRQYLREYESPLEPYADLIVQLADEYNFDYRWLVAIAQQESNLCKRIPVNSYNCWGWGIYNNPKTGELQVIRFDGFDDALRRIAPQFKEIFLKGNHTREPSKVMKTYTPPSDGSWANGVNQFFSDLE